MKWWLNFFLQSAYLKEKLFNHKKKKPRRRRMTPGLLLSCSGLCKRATQTETPCLSAFLLQLNSSPSDIFALSCVNSVVWPQVLCQPFLSHPVHRFHLTFLLGTAPPPSPPPPPPSPTYGLGLSCLKEEHVAAWLQCGWLIIVIHTL